MIKELIMCFRIFQSKTSMNILKKINIQRMENKRKIPNKNIQK